MALTTEDLEAIKGIVDLSIESSISPLRTELKELSAKVDKVLKFVPIENADFNPLNGKAKLEVLRHEEEA
jgi:hypothetical protein